MPNNKKVWPCADCDKIFSTKSNLNRHEAFHKGIVNMFMCELCKKTFTTKDGLRKHG